MANEPLIVGIGGTLRERSYSRAALRETLRAAADAGARTELLDLRELSLAMFVPDRLIVEYGDAERAPIERLIDAYRRADALVWSTPTYHGTISGVLKNALDFVELMHADVPPYLGGRAIGLIAVSDPKAFAAMASCAHELRAWLAPSHLLFSGDDFTPVMTWLAPSHLLFSGDDFTPVMTCRAARQ